MGYTAVKGGLEAILAAEALVAGREGRVSVEQVKAGLRLLVDQAMGEGGLYAEDLAALAVSTSLLLFQFQLTEANPERARAAYAESRRVRGLPVQEERLAAMFSPSGRRAAWAIGAAMTIGPLVLLLARRREFEAAADHER